jgi:cell division protein ZapA (FtsZ GTPase activity inhibitor)
MNKPSTITIDGKEYAEDTLSDEAKAQLQNVIAVDQKMAALQQDLAIVQTARNAYMRALQTLLDTTH